MVIEIVDRKGNVNRERGIFEFRIKDRCLDAENTIEVIGAKDFIEARKSLLSFISRELHSNDIKVLEVTQRDKTGKEILD